MLIIYLKKKKKRQIEINGCVYNACMITCSCQLEAENFSDPILQVHKDDLAANINNVHLLSKWHPTPCVSGKITCCTAAVKKAPPVQAKGRGITARRCGLL